jgi:glutathione synthase/RimK-type ligase-like ATP-grasp enzyme
MKRVGILCGREKSFPDGLIAELARRDAGVVAEPARVDLLEVGEPSSYDVLVDRISHDVPCYQPILKVAALHGARVVNNPFWRIADDKAVGTALARKLGVPVPKTVVLPSKSYGPDVTSASLRNLAYPLDWDGMIAALGLPMYLKPHWGGGFRNVRRVESKNELWRAYDESGELTLIAQQEIVWTQYVRCVVIGKADVLALPWDPRLSHYDRYAKARDTMPALDPALVATIERHARTLCEALGYDMNTVEFAVKDGVPYAIDFMNSAPDFDVSSLGEEAFAWTVGKMADLVTRLAREPRAERYRWDALLGA